MKRILIAGSLVLLSAVADAGIEHTMLHGVEIRGVRVWSGGATAIPGLTEHAIQEVVEGVVVAGGVPVSESADPVLSVLVRAFASGPGECNVTVETALVEEAQLERNGQWVTARSWNATGLEHAGSMEQCGVHVLRWVRKQAEEFVEHYAAMNP